MEAEPSNCGKTTETAISESKYMPEPTRDEARAARTAEGSAEPALVSAAETGNPYNCKRSATDRCRQVMPLQTND